MAVAGTMRTIRWNVGGADPPCALEDSDDNWDRRRQRSARRWIVGLAILAIVMIGLAIGTARGQDRGDWFKSLKQNGTGYSCCDISDCKETDADWQDGQWWATVNGTWMPIPPDKELDVLSIDGDAYVCASPNDPELCSRLTRWLFPSFRSKRVSGRLERRWRLVAQSSDLGTWYGNLGRWSQDYRQAIPAG